VFATPSKQGVGSSNLPGRTISVNPIQSKGLTEIILHPWLHPGHLLFWQMVGDGGTMAFFTVVLSIQ